MVGRQDRFPRLRHGTAIGQERPRWHPSSRDRGIEETPATGSGSQLRDHRRHSPGDRRHGVDQMAQAQLDQLERHRSSRDRAAVRAGGPGTPFHGTHNASTRNRRPRRAGCAQRVSEQLLRPAAGRDRKAEEGPATVAQRKRLLRRYPARDRRHDRSRQAAPARQRLHRFDPPGTWPRNQPFGSAAEQQSPGRRAARGAGSRLATPAGWPWTETTCPGPFQPS